jgi:ribosomal protein S18 acetylase RimI-like enzyme
LIRPFEHTSITTSIPSSRISCSTWLGVGIAIEGEAQYDKAQHEKLSLSHFQARQRRNERSRACSAQTQQPQPNRKVSCSLHSHRAQSPRSALMAAVTEEAVMSDVDPRFTFHHYRGKPGLSPSSLSPLVASILTDVSRLEKEAFPTIIVPDRTTTSSAIGAWLVNLQSSKSVLFVVTSPSSSSSSSSSDLPVVAFLHATFSSGSCKIVSLATSQPHRQSGLASKLLTNALSLGGKLFKTNYASLNVDSRNFGALRLYEKVGFQAEGDLVPQFYSDGGSARRLVIDDIMGTTIFKWDEGCSSEIV